MATLDTQCDGCGYMMHLDSRYAHQSRYCEFNQTMPRTEFQEMIKKEGWKLKEVVQH